MALNVGDEEVAIRAHDIVVCMERQRATEYDALSNLGLAARLALQLRGAPPVSYELLKKVAVYHLNFHNAEVKPVVEMLAEAEFVSLVSEGTTIKTVIPDVPFFDNLYTTLGAVAQQQQQLTEAEQLTIALANKLAQAPMVKDSLHTLGAETKLVNDVVRIGEQGAFILRRRARGRDVLLSSSLFADNEAAYADLVAAKGSGRVKKVLDILRSNQGWPLALLERNKLPNGQRLDAEDLEVIRALAGDGFVRPPAIMTTAHGTNYFMFGPRPGGARLPLNKKSVYEAAMALVAAVRQGQLLPAQFAIWSPVALLEALRDRGFIRANSEAIEQYQRVAQLKVGRLEHEVGTRYRFVLNDRPENREAINLAIELFGAREIQPRAEEELTLALRQGESYVESLLGRKHLVADKLVSLDEESKEELATLLYGGGI